MRATTAARAVSTGQTVVRLTITYPIGVSSPEHAFLTAVVQSSVDRRSDAVLWNRWSRVPIHRETRGVVSHIRERNLMCAKCAFNRQLIDLPRPGLPRKLQRS